MGFLTDDWRSDARRLASGGAWLFILGSAFALAWLIASGGGWSGQVFGTEVGGESYSAPLLSYSGVFGVVWVWMQLLSLIVATALTLLPWARPRRLGHALLIGWSALWTVGALRLAMVDPASFWPVQTLVMSGFLGCTVFRAARNWCPPEVPPTLRIDTPVPASTHSVTSTDDIPPYEPSRTDVFKARVNAMCHRAESCAHKAWDQAKAAAHQLTPKIKSAARQVRQGWSSSSPSQSA